MQGHTIKYVPGWDCHGLPIELKAVEQGKGASLSPIEIRKKAHACAEEAIALQMSGYRSWGVMGEWDNPYATKGIQPPPLAAVTARVARPYVLVYCASSRSQVRSLAARPVPRPVQEGFFFLPFSFLQLIGVFGKRYLKGPPIFVRVCCCLRRVGYVYRGLKPVIWSPSSRTALAEAEVEYSDSHVSPSVYVAFPVKHLGTPPPNCPVLMLSKSQAACTADPVALTSPTYPPPLISQAGRSAVQVRQSARAHLDDYPMDHPSQHGTPFLRAPLPPSFTKA
jgi:isoleucyl-tRNA synthetase